MENAVKGRKNRKDNIKSCRKRHGKRPDKKTKFDSRSNKDSIKVLWCIFHSQRIPTALYLLQLQ